jgi:cathepsin L
VKWTMNVNPFSDLTADEFRNSKGRGYSKRVGFRQALTTTADARLSKLPPLEDLPPSKDWRTENVVTPVKDQAQCGSCWAFASAETLESHSALATGKLNVLSPQNLVSCAPNPDDCGGVGGCEGSIPELAYDYVAKSGIALESDYPYKGVTGTCNTAIKPAVQCKGYVKLPENNYTAVMGALATIGPLAINVDAMQFQRYGKGIWEPKSYDKVDIDHVVQLVGYGSDTVNGTNVDYWLVRNSWSENWGENGYIRIVRHDGSDEWCGKDETPEDGTGCDGGPKVVTPCGAAGVLYDVSYPTF